MRAIRWAMAAGIELGRPSWIASARTVVASAAAMISAAASIWIKLYPVLTRRLPGRVDVASLAPALLVFAPSIARASDFRGIGQVFYLPVLVVGLGLVVFIRLSGKARGVGIGIGILVMAFGALFGTGGTSSNPISLQLVYWVAFIIIAALVASWFPRSEAHGELEQRGEVRFERRGWRVPGSEADRRSIERTQGSGAASESASSDDRDP